MFGLAQTPSIGSPDQWSQYGLSGLVIFALFVGFFAMVFWVMRQQAVRDEKQQSFLQGVLDKHVSERIEWRRDADEKTAQYTQSLDRLTSSTVKALEGMQLEIRELHKAMK